MWRSHFPRNLAPNLTQYLREQRKEGLKPMNDQDSGTIIITVLLLLPWLGRAAVSAVAMWREHIETQTRKAKQNFYSEVSVQSRDSFYILPQWTVENEFSTTRVQTKPNKKRERPQRPGHSGTAPLLGQSN